MQNSPSPSTFRSRNLIYLLTGLISLGSATIALASDGPISGEQVYRSKCASCHGSSGEGSREYARPLLGDKSTSQLTRLIERTMPEDDPGSCLGEEARSVAAYIHDAFYSKTAQARNKPARIELSRLTVRQYRNALGDLIGSFRESSQWDGKEHGLRGEYYKANHFRNNDRVFTRIDPEVKFDFGVLAPQADKFSPQEFSISWKGSILAPETGEFEFIVKTEHSLRLWVNDNEHALIDAWVKSGNDTEYRASIYLVAGRTYPIRLDFSKGKQGVEDSKEKKAKAPAVKASIALEWKLPHRPPEVIPSGQLSPNRSPEQYVCTTPFPPDDRSVGYERGTSISKEWDQATTEGVLELTDYLAPRLKELAGAGPDSGDREAKLRDFCLKFAERAFRRPLTAEQKERYVFRQFSAGSDLETAVKRVVLLVLKSPRFLYRELDCADGFDVAARLSFGLWDSLPDSELMKAAASGKLKSREQIKAQAERMVNDIRTRAKLREFLHQWLKVEHVPDLAKDPSKYPGFDPSVASDLRSSLDLFLDDVIWSHSSDFRRLLLENQVYMNGRLATFYGVELPPDASFQKVTLDSGKRAGVLTHPYLLANFAYTSTSSPIHRGVFIARSVLGRSLRPPPEAVSPLAPDLHAGLTTRERVSLQTSPNACVTCHGMINPLGFGLENYDAVGRFRVDEKGKPVDVNGSYEPPNGEFHKYVGARELAGLLAESDESHDAFVQQLFHHMVQQPIRAFGARQLPELKKSFSDHHDSVRELLVEIVTASTVNPPPPPPKPSINRDALFPVSPFSSEK
jgi:hypothetical protein